jgi:hypothetical protein
MLRGSFTKLPLFFKLFYERHLPTLAGDTHKAAHLELLYDRKMFVIARYEAIRKRDTLDCFVPYNDTFRK